ncbi:MAG: flagellar motor switch protein FliN [Bryobacteraceae bacterium]
MTIAQWLAQEWARQIGPALSSMVGEPFQAAVPSGQTGARAGNELVLARRLREMPEAVLWIALREEVWRGAGTAILRSVGVEDASEEEIRNAFLEVVDQSLGQVASTLGARLGREVSWETAEEPPPEGPVLAWVPVELAGAEGAVGMMWVAAGPGFLVELPDPAAKVPERGGDQAAAPLAEHRRPMLELLMEVELPVGVTFGRTQLKLKDAIKLTSGSIVELNRSIIEPVEVIVNNCVIARGEVVVIEGNYGVRIQEIVSREERLRTLF